MRKLVFEISLALPAVAATAMVLQQVETGTERVSGDVPATLAMFASGTAVATSFLAELTACISGHPPLRRISAAMAVYALVVVPATAAGDGGDTATVLLATARHAAGLCTALLLLASASPYDRPRPWRLPGFRTPAGGSRGGAIALGCTLVAVLAAASAPEVAAPLVTSPLMGAAVSLLWVDAGLLMIASGLIRYRPVSAWTGVGVIAIISGHAPRLLLGEPIVSSVLLVPGMRLVGLLLILCVVLRVAFLVHRQITLDREQLRDARAEASQTRERMSEQVHELRNALAGVDGVAHLLALGEGGDVELDRAALRAALSAELGRMRALLDEGVSSRPEEPVRLAGLLRQLVLIRRTTGMRIDLSVEEDLASTAPHRVIAQVVTNVLANCERHAPGARVTVTAYRTGDQIRIRVHDDGPGVPPGQQEEVLRRGVKREGSPGQGIGLHLCRELLSAHGGRLRLVSAPPEEPGCTVLVDLPARPVRQGWAPLAHGTARGERPHTLGGDRAGA
ncbi:hypothetical protein GCM10027294_31560 [Marinactinospora endophytica]